MQPPWTAVGLALLVVAAHVTPASSAGSEPASARAQIDHLVVGIFDLDQGIAEIEKLTGVRPVFGGEHPGVGTHNALLALGPRQYLEIVAPQRGSELDERVAGLGELTTLTPIAWAVSMSDLEATAEALRSQGFELSEPVPGSRVKPDGAKLEWVTFGIESPRLAGAPFFIRWSESSVHPAETSPTGCRIEELRLGDLEATGLRRLLEALHLDRVRVKTTPSPAFEIGLVCATGPVRLGRLPE